MTDELTVMLATVIRTKMLSKARERGLDENDHLMFERALKGYERCRDELHEKRKLLKGVVTHDPRMSKEWVPNRQVVPRNSTGRKQKLAASDMDDTQKDIGRAILSRLDDLQ